MSFVVTVCLVDLTAAVTIPPPSPLNYEEKKMVLTRKAILCFGLVIALIATVMMVSPVLADDETPADTPKAESAEDTPEDEPQTEEEKDPFEVPEEATPDELVDYIQQMRKMRPEEPGRRALVEFIRKSRKSIIGAADKILESEDATKAQKSIGRRDQSPKVDRGSFEAGWYLDVDENARSESLRHAQGIS
jgi:hypothetical protein